MVSRNVRLRPGSCTPETTEKPANGGICHKNRGRSRARPAARRAWILGSRSARPLLAARISGLLGQAPGSADLGSLAAPPAEAEAGRVFGIQPAVSHADPSRAAYPEFAGTADQTAEGRTTAADFRERAGTGQRRRVALRGVCGAGNRPQNLHHNFNGGRE